jgi:hypothetical protein
MAEKMRAMSRECCAPRLVEPDGARGPTPSTAGASMPTCGIRHCRPPTPRVASAARRLQTARAAGRIKSTLKQGVISAPFFIAVRQQSDDKGAGGKPCAASGPSFVAECLGKNTPEIELEVSPEKANSLSM